MSESVYRFTEVVETSTEWWERRASVAVETAARTVRNLRVAQVEQLDLVIENGQVTAYRAKVSISFMVKVGQS
jgi:flavin-binding protein dodecin